MRLRSLIKNQVLSIDDHKWGCQEEKKWDFKHCDIHVDKRTNFPINGKIREVQIKIPINSNRPIGIKNKLKTLLALMKYEMLLLLMYMMF